MKRAISKLDDISEAQRKRIQFIDYRSYFLGKIVRRDLQEKFGVAEAAATRDFSLYNEIAPYNLIYQPQIRAYVVSDKFKPVYKYPEAETLEKITKDFAGTSAFIHEGSLRLGRLPSIKDIAVITRAIHSKKVIECDYLSTSSGKSTKQVVPHSLINTGLHWYFRGYDKNRERFADFVLSRLLSSRTLDKLPRDEEKQTSDTEWNNTISLVITAHKNQNHPETIEFDYGMENGQLVKEVRASLAGYLLRRWNVDCSDEGSLEGYAYQLRLQNVSELKAVESLGLAPGFQKANGL